MEFLKNQDMLMDIIDKTDIISKMKVGFWVIEYPEEGQPRMYGDPMMHLIMGNDKEMSPEEMHQFWFERIDSTYVQMIEEAINNLKKNYTTEARYPWYHPKKGWTFVRCGAFRDESYKAGVRIKGFHKDVTEQMELEIREDDKHKVVDLKKLKMYSPYFIEMCDELFEIDAVDFTIRTIFYRKDKYSEITEETDIFSVISRFVHPDDIQKVEAVFSERGLTQIVEENQIVKIEFRTKTRFDTYTWVEGKALYVKTGNLKKILFITYDIESKKQMSLLAKETNAILDAFINLYKAILEVDLLTEKVQVLKTMGVQTQLYQDNTLQLADQLPKMLEQLDIESERQELLEFFEIKHLKEMAALKKEQSLDLRFEKENKQFEWIQIKILYLPGREDKIYVVFGNSDKEHVLNSIAEKFVYKNSDWFYYLDLKNDYFIRYSGNADEHTLPPEEGWDYRNAMIEYSKECVVSEDQDWVIACMEPEYMINRLDKEDGEYQISFGVSDDMGGYRRKEIVCRYYDEENKIVLVQRNDITEDYESS